MKKDLGQIDDLQLIQLIKEGNDLALQVLFDKYYDTLLELAMHFLKNISLAEEVVADTFLKLWEKRETLSIQQSPKAYLLRAIKNASLNMLKKEQYSFRQAASKEETDSHNPESIIQYNQLFQQVDQLISEMPTQRQLVFRLNRLDGLRYKEIAELLDISVETVQKHMTQAVKFMSLHKAKITAMVHHLLALITFGGLFC